MGTKSNFPPPRIEDFPILQIVPVEPEPEEHDPIEQTIDPDFITSVWVNVPKKNESN